MKKFKPPSFINKPDNIPHNDGPPSKKIKVSQGSPALKVSERNSAELLQKQSLGIVRKPLLTLRQPFVVASPAVVRDQAAQTEEQELYFNIVWRKPTNKKHKTWDGDGILSVCGIACLMQDTSGRDIARGRLKVRPDSLSIGDSLTVGSKECEIEGVLAQNEYKSGQVFLKNAKALPVVNYTVLKSQARAQFKNPLLNDTVLHKTISSAPPQARHDPHGHNSLVLTRPSSAMCKGVEHVVDVVVDPMISQFLRPHQKEGVSFLYDCIMRFKEYDGAGAILADEMGLGKTLQTIALIWTILKQHFIPGQGPLARKALIVCPVTLINNWKKEFRKWLGQDKIGVFVVDSKANMRDFVCGKVYQVMIIGYEKLRLVQETDELKNANFDLIVCDEGHKLKSANNKSAQAIKLLKTSRRIILSGTPIQNDLGEFFVMIDFVNPGLLGSYQTFKKEFENPIMKARQPEATKKDKEKGALRSAELSRLTEMFILRRTAELLSGYLPAKTDFVVYCQPTELQLKLHKMLLQTPAVEQCLGGQNTAFQLKAIMHLRKICNSPALLSSDLRESNATGDTFLASVQNLIPARASVKQSGKLLVLEKMLLALVKTGEKIVLVSQFTQTLQILQGLLDSHGMAYCRLDGSTATTKRQEMVDKFNRAPATTVFAFLLSAKSGGCGLNLIGASRLILFDSDWNPSVDLQAMARVHRDGQKRPVFIYRFLTTGMIDEKIYQRQVTKQSLSDTLMDSKASGSAFSLEELRDLFRCHEDTDCLTHDMLQCPCKHDGQNQSSTALQETGDSEDEQGDSESVSWVKASQIKQTTMEKKPRNSNMKALRMFEHVSATMISNNQSDEPILPDAILEEVTKSTDNSAGRITYVFAKRNGIAPPTPDESGERKGDVDDAESKSAAD